MKDHNEAYQTLVARTFAKLKTWQFTNIQLHNASECQSVKARVYIPDLTGVLEEKQYLFAVETRDSLRGDIAYNRMIFLSKYAFKNKNILVIVVPREIEDAAYQLVRSLGLQNTIILPIHEWPSRVNTASQEESLPFMLHKPT